MFWFTKLTLGYNPEGVYPGFEGDMQINGVNKTHSLIVDSNFVI